MLLDQAILRLIGFDLKFWGRLVARVDRIREVSPDSDKSTEKLIWMHEVRPQGATHDAKPEGIPISKLPGCSMRKR